jgi:cyclohexadieny/prephenate dehydrogenase
MTKPTIALIGLGLIGSSLGHAFKKHQLAGQVRGYARSRETREAALNIGFVDVVYESAAAAAQGADIIFFNVPMGAFYSLAVEIMPALKSGAIITDVGSVKASVIEDISPILRPDVYLVPGHPIAGTEQSGPAAGFADLFVGRWCVLTPTPDTNLRAVETVAKLWRDIGSDVEFMDADQHDLVLAITSHIPHLIAYNIVGTASDLEADTRSDVIKFSASGFRDFTRIAASDPIMWRDIFLRNKRAVLEMLGRFNEDLTALQRAIRHDDGDTLQDMFSRTRDIRKSIIDAGQDVAEPNFGRNSKSDKS